MNALGLIADEFLEATVFGSFSRFGYLVRRQTAHWMTPPSM
jgi:hypothetical protein